MRKPLVGLLFLFLAPGLASGPTVNAPNRLWAAQPQAAAETDWNNLQRLPFGTLLLIEQTDEKWIRGGLVAVASDALSLGRRKRVRGIARSRVRRIWLLGGKQVGEGALIGTLVGGVLGVLIARPPLCKVRRGRRLCLLFRDGPCGCRNRHRRSNRGGRAGAHVDLPGAASVALAALLLEGLPEGDQGLHAFEREGVVERGAQAE